jgi:hypothetical protein
MTSGTQTKVGQFVEVGWGIHGVLIGSRVFLPLRWTMLEKVLGVGAVRRWFYLTAKPPHVGVGVDGLACLLHRPTTCSYQMREHGLLSGVILSCRCSGRWCLPGDVKPLGRGYLMEC